MKTRTVVLGCLAVVVIAVVVAAVGLFFLWNTDFVQGGVDMARSGAGVVGSFKKLEEISELDRQIQSDPDYAPPAEGELTAEQVDRYLAVLAAMRAETEGRMTAAEERYENLAGPDGEGSPGQVAEALGDLAEIVLEAKRVQVAELEEQGFSREEYAWVKRQIYYALGFGDLSTVDMSDLAQAAQEGRLEDVEDLARGGERAVPEANVALVEPHEELLRESVLLAVLGP